MSHLLLTQNGPIAGITLNRPEVRNAFNDELIAEITAAFTTLGRQDDVRVIVLRGEGKAFCAGADLAYMGRVAEYDHNQNLADARKLQGMFEAIYMSPKATLASVQGAAFGGGLGLAAVCDVVVAAEDAVFAFSEARLGMAPAVISPFVIRKIGVGNARALFVTGEPFSAATALRIGLCHEVVPAEQLEDAVLRVANSILKCGPLAVAACKGLLERVDGKDAFDVAGITAETIADLRVSEEGREGIQAFLEKRPPHWVPDP